MFDLSSAQWFKSLHSGGSDECIEVAWLPAGNVGVRDSKNPAGPALVFTPGEWDAFTAGVRDSEYPIIEGACGFRRPICAPEISSKRLIS
jgi:hypothetical protein